jgi:nucleotide-binding universal stress UspA family protein
MGATKLRRSRPNLPCAFLLIRLPSPWRQSRFKVLIAFGDTPRVSSFDRASTMLRAQKSGLEQAWNLLASASGSVRSARPPHLEVLSGHPVNAIVGYADELEADLIVVGSHRRGGLEPFLIGSVSDGIVRHASMPVLVVPLTNETQKAGRYAARPAAAYGLAPAA